MTIYFMLPKSWREVSWDSLERRRQEGRRKNHAWLNKNAHRYAGQWVFLGDGRMIGRGHTRAEAIQQGRALALKAAARMIVLINPDGTVFFPGV